MMINFGASATLFIALHRILTSIRTPYLMKKCFSVLLVFIPLIFAACDQGTDPGNDPGTDPGKGKDTLTNSTDTLTFPPDTVTYSVADTVPVKRDYRAGRGKVQITAIYFHQTLNQRYYGLNDEWVILESDRVMPTKGWKIDASDGQQYDLPDTIYRKLYIYTMKGPGYENDTIKTLNQPGTRWIWNNTEPDTAKVLNPGGGVVDQLTYKAKR